MAKAGAGVGAGGYITGPAQRLMSAGLLMWRGDWHTLVGSEAELGQVRAAAQPDTTHSEMLAVAEGHEGRQQH